MVFSETDIRDAEARPGVAGLKQAGCGAGATACMDECTGNL
jgi:hypothetical protein